MKYTLSKHAEDVIREREIQLEWVTETITAPSATAPDPDDRTLMHALRPIMEFDSRVLRVVFNQTRNPPHVVTVYFDRTMKGNL